MEGLNRILISIGRAQKIKSQKPQKSTENTLLHRLYYSFSNAEDADESVNDTFLDCWHNMPPHRQIHALYILGKNHPLSIH